MSKKVWLPRIYAHIFDSSEEARKDKGQCEITLASVIALKRSCRCSRRRNDEQRKLKLASVVVVVRNDGGDDDEQSLLPSQRLFMLMLMLMSAVTAHDNKMMERLMVRTAGRCRDWGLRIFQEIPGNSGIFPASSRH